MESVDFYQKNYNAKKDEFLITEDDIKTLIKDADDVRVTNYLQASVVSGHGSVSIGKFLQVPRQTIIVTFVTDGKFHLDRENVNTHLEGGKRIVAMNHLFLWMKNVVSTIAATQQFSAKDQKFFLQMLFRDHQHYRKFFPAKYTSTYFHIDPNFIVYQEGDLIPDQHFFLADVSFPGIHDWTDALLNSKKQQRETSYFGFPPDHVYHKIKDLTSRANRNTNLQAVLDFMHQKNKEQKLNIVFLQACRAFTVNNLTLRAESSFLYKNLLHQYNFIASQYVRNLAWKRNKKKRKHSRSADIFEKAVIKFVNDYSLGIRKEHDTYQDALAKFCKNNSAPFFRVLEEMSLRSGTDADFMSIFYEYICFFLGSPLKKEILLIYYSDVLDLPMQKLTDQLFDTPIPIRDDNGKFINIGLSPVRQNNNWINAVFRKADAHEIFYIPDCEAARFAMKFVRGDSGPSSWPAQARPAIFKLWWRLLEPYISDAGTYKKIFREMMENYFVKDSGYRVPPETNKEIKDALTQYIDIKRSSPVPFHSRIGGIIFASNEKYASFVENYLNTTTFRDLSFPYTSPIEFALANFVYDPQRRQFVSWAQLLKNISQGKIPLESLNESDPQALYDMYRKIAKIKKVNIILPDRQTFSDENMRNLINRISWKSIPWSIWKEFPSIVLWRILDTEQLNYLVGKILASADASPLVAEIKHKFFHCDRLGVALWAYQYCFDHLPRILYPRPPLKVSQKSRQRMEKLAGYRLIDAFSNYLYSVCYKAFISDYNTGTSIIKSHRGLTVMLLNFCYNNKEKVLDFYRKNTTAAQKPKSKKKKKML
jgi:hypothetical protein